MLGDANPLRSNRSTGDLLPVGTLSFDDAVAMVREAITPALEHQAIELLVDTRELIGFPVPDTFQRFLSAVDWAEAAQGCLRLAMIARPEMIDRDKFGITVANNRALTSNIFPTAAEARAWLDAVAAGETR